jgi:hypothetical protein
MVFYSNGEEVFYALSTQMPYHKGQQDKQV